MQRTVLIVDDDAEIRDNVQRLIERHGYRAVCAESASEGLRALKREPSIHLVLADHDMPGMDGVQMLELMAVRAPNVLRVLLTARQDAHTAVRAINRAQVWRFIQKPFRATELLTALHFGFAEAENPDRAPAVRHP